MTTTVYYVNHDYTKQSGPFSTREAAEQFAIAIATASAGKQNPPDAIRIVEVERDED